MSHPHGQRQMERLLVGVSGSAAVFNLLSYLVVLRGTLTKEVRVIMTAAADALLPATTVAHVCDGVFIDDPPSVEKRPGHLELARWAEAFVILPASANLLGQAANGLAPNLLTTTILASAEPVIFCPNVNDVMWRKPAVQRNVETLCADGHLVIRPERAMVYEVESGEMQQSWAMPDPERLTERLKDILDRRRNGA
ncbi:MAG: Mersacidin decarboxylase [Actinomycetota bacterium]|nr:Mersacidin decarboxylase [Actinomycetota bacterium]